jgi:hypothetical protein
MASRTRLSLAVAGACLIGVSLTACGSGEQEGESCGERSLIPHISSISFGELYPLGNREPDVSSSVRSPFEYVLLLHAPCSAEVAIEEVCLIGDSNRGGADVAPFILEGPEPDKARRGRDAVLRLTYEGQTPHEGDEGDHIAIVIQSNAEDNPTLVVPLCARVVAEGTEKSELVCRPPVTVQPGQKVADLCSR